MTPYAVPLLVSVLVDFTSPGALGAIVVGLALVAFVAWTVAREKAQGPAAEGSDAEPRERGVQAQPTGQAAAAASGGSGTSQLARGKGSTLAELVATEEVDNAALLSRFVLNTKGETVGETLALTDDDQVILKKDGVFYAVAQESVIEKNGTLLADANIDWDAAKTAGEAWQAASMDEIEYDEHGMPVSK